MASVTEQIAEIKQLSRSTLALILGATDKGLLFTYLGNVNVYGCKVTKTSLTEFSFNDDDNVNPFLEVPAERVEEFPNVALVYGSGFLLENTTRTIDGDALPSATFTRKDIVYLYYGDSGPSIDIAEGIAVVGTPIDPVIPIGSMPVARLNIDDTGIQTVDDLRDFDGRLRGDDGIMASIVAGANIDVDSTDPANPIVSATLNRSQVGKNLLINADFSSESVINQRDFAGGQPASGIYGFDRWLGSSGGVGLTQIIEAGSFKTSAEHTLSGTNITTIQINSPASGDWQIDVPANADLIQLELGDVATDFEYVDKNIKISQCVRYFQALSRTILGDNTGEYLAYAQNRSATTSRVIVNFCMEFRVPPTLSTIGAFTVTTGAGSGQAVTNLVVDGTSKTKSIGLSITVAGGLTAGEIGMFRCNTSSALLFDAEIYF